VNAFMARALLRFARPDTVFWIQDYHFWRWARNARSRSTQPIGFFLHTPWAAPTMIEGVPHHRELIEAMLAYDLIGFQTADDCENFSMCLVRSRSRYRQRHVSVAHGKPACRGIPIGIDVDKFAVQAAKAVSHPECRGCGEA
jgi:trehalose 6-phosphate synthase